MYSLSVWHAQAETGDRLRRLVGAATGVMV